MTPVAQAHIRERVARIEIDLSALEWSVLRELSTPTDERTQVSASGLKILGSELQQRLSELAIDVMGMKGLTFFDSHNDPEALLPADSPAELPGLAARQLFMRATTIYAGTNEIQNEIIARQIF